MAQSLKLIKAALAFLASSASWVTHWWRCLSMSLILLTGTSEPLASFQYPAGTVSFWSVMVQSSFSVGKSLGAQSSSAAVPDTGAALVVQRTRAQSGSRLRHIGRGMHAVVLRWGRSLATTGGVHRHGNWLNSTLNNTWAVVDDP